MQPKEVALEFIRPYILRGDSEESFIKTCGGVHCSDYGVQIGGWIYNDKGEFVYRAKRNEIIVTRIKGDDCFFKYDIYPLAKEIRLEKQGIKQGELQFY